MKNPAAIARALPPIIQTDIPSESIRGSRSAARFGAIHNIARLAARQQALGMDGVIDFDAITDDSTEFDTFKEAMEKASRIR